MFWFNKIYYTTPLTCPISRSFPRRTVWTSCPRVRSRRCLPSPRPPRRRRRRGWRLRGWRRGGSWTWWLEEGVDGADIRWVVRCNNQSPAPLYLDPAPPINRLTCNKQVNIDNVTFWFFMKMQIFSYCKMICSSWKNRIFRRIITKLSMEIVQPIWRPL